MSSSLIDGANKIKEYVSHLPDTPGVYRMLSEKGDVLYVGKAKNLKKRVSSYTRYEGLSVRIQRMIALTHSMEFVHTSTEAEALLLEANLIKSLKPRYNILLRDDKSFPYLLLTTEHSYPQITKHRGVKSEKGEYYGPFSSAGMVNKTINILQRAFMLRNCSDTVFASRNRPCLQYHIKRCTAPCVDYVNAEEYANQVKDVKDFLSGKSMEVKERFSAKMLECSDGMEFEKAAEYRDRIRALAHVQSSQSIHASSIGDADVVALYKQDGRACVQIFFFRAGQNYGNHPYFPKHVEEQTDDEILGAFIAQFYTNKPIPKEVIVSGDISNQAVLEEALSERKGARVRIVKPKRGDRLDVLKFASDNAQNALQRYLVENANEAKLLDGVAQIFHLDDRPRRIEVYDNSHISGTDMIGAMIVAGEDGFNKKAYRKFNIKEAGSADDYAMMREVLERRFKRALKDERGMESEDWPDLVLIDGGIGQFNAVKEILEDYGVWGDVKVVAIAKGVERNAGRERFFMEGRMDFRLPEKDPVLHYLQRLRDEAHRFAIGAHRSKRTKKISRSPLDEIAGIGAQRKKALLLYFGSAKDVAGASLDDLQKVDGISKAVAQKIHDFFRDEA